MSRNQLNVCLQYGLHFFSFAGIIISLYALLVETLMERDTSYTPMCDISCSKAFLSPWGKGFGLIGPLLGEDHPLNLKNPVFGVAFYSLLIILALIPHRLCAKIHFYLVIVANFGSVYLGYILYTRVQSLCVICLATYLINFILLIISHQRQRLAHRHTEKKRR